MKKFKHKIGEYLIARRNVSLPQSIIIKDKSYLIKNIIPGKPYGQIVFDSEDIDNRKFDDYAWDEYFYTKVEERKFKLEKLNKDEKTRKSDY